MENKIKYCQFCRRECKNDNSLRNHERLCKENPNRQISYGNKGHMPKHISSYYTNKIKARNGDELDITRQQLEDYRLSHPVCEICGKSINESIKWESKFAAKNLCIDHDHTTKHFRGLLCSACNRQLGWYEKYVNEIEHYLNK